MKDLKNENERMWESICLKMWRETYKLNDDDDRAYKYACELSQQMCGTDYRENIFLKWSLRFLFGAKWLHCGRVQLTTSHKYASALMSSDVRDSIVEDMIVPWKAFSVKLPDGLLCGEGISFKRIDVGIYDNLKTPSKFGCCIELKGDLNEGKIETSFTRFADSAASAFFGGGHTEIIGDPHNLGFKEKSMTLAVRLVTGLLYTMQHTNNFRRCGHGGDRKKNERDGPPQHRVYFVGAPIKVDCRPDVDRYLKGTKKLPPSMQTLVRGHYKRQVIGVARSGRKVIWIEPYWRGPEDAPILSRPYRVES